MHFQLEPNEEQKELMHSMLDALFEKQNFVAEVPRGAGATFCTLNAVLGWLYQRSLLAPKAFAPRILFVCRSQAKIPDVRPPHADPRALQVLGLRGLGGGARLAGPALRGAESLGLLGQR